MDSNLGRFLVEQPDPGTSLSPNLVGHTRCLLVHVQCCLTQGTPGHLLNLEER